MNLQVQKITGNSVTEDLLAFQVGLCFMEFVRLGSVQLKQCIYVTCVYNNCSKWPLSCSIRSLAPFSAPTEVVGCPSGLAVPLTSCFWGGIFSKNAGSFILQNVSVNVACQSYSFAVLPA